MKLNARVKELEKARPFAHPLPRPAKHLVDILTNALTNDDENRSVRDIFDSFIGEVIHDDP